MPACFPLPYYPVCLPTPSPLPTPPTKTGEGGNKGLLDETITFTAPAIGSYYFSMAAVSCVAQHMADNPLSLYRLVPVAGLPSKAPPPQMTVNLPPNATQAQRMQVRLLGHGRDTRHTLSGFSACSTHSPRRPSLSLRQKPPLLCRLPGIVLQAQQALAAAQQAAANAPPKQVDGWVPTRLISDLFVSGRDPATPTGAGDTCAGQCTTPAASGLSAAAPGLRAVCGGPCPAPADFSITRHRAAAQCEAEPQAVVAISMTGSPLVALQLDSTAT